MRSVLVVYFLKLYFWNENMLCIWNNADAVITEKNKFDECLLKNCVYALEFLLGVVLNMCLDEHCSDKFYGKRVF